MKNSALRKAGFASLCALLISLAAAWFLLTFFQVEQWLYLWHTGRAACFFYVLPPCALLALAAGAVVWTRETLAELRLAYGAITAKLQTKLDHLEAEIAALKQERSAPHSEHED